MGHKKKSSAKTDKLVEKFGQLIDTQTNAIAKMDKRRDVMLPEFYQGSVIVKQK